MKLLVIFSLLFLLNVSVPLFADEVKWQAQWIMHPSVQPQEHAVIIFRKNFELASQPASFIIHISADQHYRLFVNGKFVLRGPARGDLSHWFYETIDIAGFLKAGKNTLAAEVINWGPKRSFTYFSQMTSFILQGDTENERMVNTGGGTWKCFHNEAIKAKNVDWMNDRSTIDFGLYVGNPTDSVRAEIYPWGWESPEYDDSAWLPAAWCDFAGGRGKQYAGGILYSGGKMLIPRRTALLAEKKINFAAIRKISGMELNDGFIKGNGILVIQPGRKVSVLIDQQYESMGYPEMIVSGGKNSLIRVMYAENLIVNNHSPKGNRNVIEGKRMVGLKDYFIPDGGNNRLFKPTYIRAFRYIQLDIETGNEPLSINAYYNMECKAPLTLKASFRSENADYDWIMQTGWRTISNCAQDIMMSDAAYEQMQYTGDSRVHNLSLLTLSGDDRLTRNALIQFDQSRIPEGLTYACYPNPFHLIIPAYSLIWIDQVYDYMYWKDDREFISDFEPGILNVIDWFERKRQANGLLGKMEWWGALAWPRHYVNGEPPDIYIGNNTLYTLHYAYTLRHAAEIFDYLGKSGKAEEFRRRADQICSSVNSHCKNQDGFYRESPTSDKVSQITNILAILSETVKGEEARALMTKLIEPKDWFGQVDLFLHLYLFEALNKTGLQDQFSAQLSEWLLMKERGMTTFAEVPLEWGEESQRSECHPWSSSPNYFIFRTICGIKPLAPGHREIAIAPAMGSLTRIDAIYPHPSGNIEISLERRGSKIEGYITIPAGTKATFIWGAKRIELEEGKQSISI